MVVLRYAGVRATYRPAALARQLSGRPDPRGVSRACAIRSDAPRDAAVPGVPRSCQRAARTDLYQSLPGHARVLSRSAGGEWAECPGVVSVRGVYDSAPSPRQGNPLLKARPDAHRHAAPLDRAGGETL